MVSVRAFSVMNKITLFPMIPNHRTGQKAEVKWLVNLTIANGHSDLPIKNTLFQ